MTSDLFPDCKQDSPRLAWMKKYGVTVRDATEDDRAFGLEDSVLYVAECNTPREPTGECPCGFGATKDEAIASLGIPLWNEEQYLNNKDKHENITSIRA